MAIFLLRVLMNQKREISLRGGGGGGGGEGLQKKATGANVTSFQDFKLSEKQISPTFSYEERTFVPVRSKLISSK